MYFLYVFREAILRFIALDLAGVRVVLFKERVAMCRLKEPSLCLRRGERLDKLDSLASGGR